MGELTTRESLPPETVELVAVTVKEIMGPLLESIGAMLRHNTEAMEQIAAAQQLTSERIAALEKKVRLQTPVSKTQEKYVSEAIRHRAKELLQARGLDGDRKAVTRLGAAIRKSVLSRYGVGTLRECPACEYEVILKQCGMWNDLVAVRDVVRAAREGVKET